MEFLPGSFEWEWERRRAALTHEMQLGKVDKSDWDEPRRGGASRLPDEGSGGFGRARLRGGGSRAGAASAGRSMRTRFAALARGSQPAVVKLASYGGGSRAGAMMSYTSREGELAVENERGERVFGKDALAEQRAEWEHLFDNRVASRDLGVFHVSIDAASLRNDVDRDDQLHEILRSGFGDRRFVYTARERSPGELSVRGVVVLRDGQSERLTGDRKAADIVQQRYDDTEVGRDVAARFRFHGYGNGVEWGAARVRELVAGTDGEVRDDTGRLIGDATQAGDLVQKEWRKELHSRKGRDVMHLIVSARAGTDAAAFEGAVREFLGEQFTGHRYVFAVHDPALDPKEMAEGGKRPHIHAHAIVTMRSETGERIVTSPQLFREWRSVMAEKAREQGIDMELTDRREFASAPAYTRNQVRPVNYRGRTEHEGTSHAAYTRYQAKRSNEVSLAATDRSRQYTATAAEVWNDLANEEPGISEGKFAMLQKARLEGIAGINQTDHIFTGSGQEAVKNTTNMIELTQLVNGEDGQMREMTRPEFEAYEKRVEDVLSSVEQSIDESDRTSFEDVAAAARDVVDVRREYLEFSERQVAADLHDMRQEAPRDRGDVAHHGEDAVRVGDELFLRIDTAVTTVATLREPEVRNDYGSGTYSMQETDAEYDARMVKLIEAEKRHSELLDRAAKEALDGNGYILEAAEKRIDLEFAINMETRRREEMERYDRGVDKDRESASISSSSNSRHDGKPGGSSEVAEAEQQRDPVQDVHSTPEQDDHVAEQQAAMPSEQRPKHPDERAAERKPALDAEHARSDPPQQHVPRLRQIELELQEREDRDRDDRDR
ncbi:relaxase/mobilization nuclease domain-containing protein [Manganibacter manganicus]|uniref:MobA/VirD2-like nuclease domain-containing protein n=1 Tax=Manganibacter manganicus TaxID=1873176 RepID=A0A1V8RJJ5_9HYPH|nr:hypothetical protein [Pseudaminobacter manganicus]OQM73377.1 hypothetical protein BFN67_08735 [Pseudaminobacter manganicus]